MPSSRPENPQSAQLAGDVTPLRERHEKLSEVLARDIASHIATRLEPGEKLPSEVLMLEQFQVGRSSLREALRILEVQGILTLKPGPGGGPVVSKPGSAAFARILALHSEIRHVHYRELVEARVALEPLAARLAAERADHGSAELLREHLDRSRQVADDDHITVVEGWADFHYLIGGLSGNGLLDLLTRALGELYRERVVRRDQVSGRIIEPADREHTDEAHAQIASAIIAGRVTRAENLMRDHMTELTAGVANRYPLLMEEVITWG